MEIAAVAGSVAIAAALRRDGSYASFKLYLTFPGETFSFGAVTCSAIQRYALVRSMQW